MSDLRRRFLDQRRIRGRHRFDTLHAPPYDEHWGQLPESHARWLARVGGMIPEGSAVLDAACGTGRAWPPLLSAGLRVTGTDQSGGMLEVAHRKHPQVPVERVALQDLAAFDQWSGRFDGLTCVDAMENVGPEDWPGVLSGFGFVLHRLAPMYVTVELPDPVETGDLDAHGECEGVPLAPGELDRGGRLSLLPAPTAGHRLVDCGWLRARRRRGSRPLLARAGAPHAVSRGSRDLQRG
ncbi:MAG: class I SAM-dependent DNA methyltransferase [Nocardioidaceae bacterium]